MPFPFLSLPAEARRQVYTLIQPPLHLNSEWTMDSMKIRLPDNNDYVSKLQLIGGTLEQRSLLRNLLFVNKQINAELTEYFYSNTTLIICFASWKYFDTAYTPCVERYWPYSVQFKKRFWNAFGGGNGGAAGEGAEAGDEAKEESLSSTRLRKLPYAKYTRHVVFVVTNLTRIWRHTNEFGLDTREGADYDPSILYYFENLKILDIRLDVRKNRWSEDRHTCLTNLLDIHGCVAPFARCDEHIDVRFRARYMPSPFSIDWYSTELFSDKRLEFLADKYLEVVEAGAKDGVVDAHAKYVERELKKWEDRKVEALDDRELETFLKREGGLDAHYGPESDTSEESDFLGFDDDDDDDTDMEMDEDDMFAEVDFDDDYDDSGFLQIPGFSVHEHMNDIDADRAFASMMFMETMRRRMEEDDWDEEEGYNDLSE